MKEVTILTGEPIIAPIAEMQMIDNGVGEMMNWVRDAAPACIPDEYESVYDIFPHDLNDVSGETARTLTDNELLVELAGRKCYNSFGLKAGRKSNKEYIAHTQTMNPPHASIMYHAKMSFFIAGVSRRVSHELIRHYVGADRDEEGSPSQESTRYVEHSGRYIAHPAILDKPEEMALFKDSMQINYDTYLQYIGRRSRAFEQETGKPPTSMDRKRIFESASPYLAHTIETSFIWTTNPVALAKMFFERDNEAADLEYLRFAQKWKRICLERWPNLFPKFAL